MMNDKVEKTEAKSLKWEQRFRELEQKYFNVDIEEMHKGKAFVESKMTLIQDKLKQYIAVYGDFIPDGKDILNLEQSYDDNLHQKDLKNILIRIEEAKRTKLVSTNLRAVKFIREDYEWTMKQRKILEPNF